jgi:hypothetical protein
MRKKRWRDVDSDSEAAMKEEMEAEGVKQRCCVEVVGR